MRTLLLAQSVQYSQRIYTLVNEKRKKHAIIHVRILQIFMPDVIIKTPQDI